MVLNIMNINITIERNTRSSSNNSLKYDKSVLIDKKVEDLKYKYVYPYLMNIN